MVDPMPPNEVTPKESHTIMKKADWMSDDGRASGERAEWLQVEAMLARAPVEVFIDSYWPVAIVILVAGGVIGAVCVANVIPASFEPWAGWLLFWVGNRLAGFLIGLAAAFII